MQDFCLIPSINFWFDGEKYFANLDWQDTDKEPIEVNASSVGILARNISSKIQAEIIRRSKDNA